MKNDKSFNLQLYSGDKEHKQKKKKGKRIQESLFAVLCLSMYKNQNIYQENPGCIRELIISIVCGSSVRWWSCRISTDLVSPQRLSSMPN